MDNRIVEPFLTKTLRLVKSEDLNHHGTLFAGRTAEWFVESGFIAATTLLDPKNVVCLKIHGMYFSKPVNPGQIVAFSSKIVHAGRSSIVAYISVTLNGQEEKTIVSGFVTFIYVDEHGKPISHHVEIKPVTEEDIHLNEMAKLLKK